MIEVLGLMASVTVGTMLIVFAWVIRGSGEDLP